MSELLDWDDFYCEKIGEKEAEAELHRRSLAYLGVELGRLRLDRMRLAQIVMQIERESAAAGLVVCLVVWWLVVFVLTHVLQAIGG